MNLSAPVHHARAHAASSADTRSDCEIGALAAEPRRRLAVLTCMDTRIDPNRILEIEIGDAHILRNAGGRATPDMIRSLVLSTHFLGVRSIWIVHHTDCGLAKTSQTAIVDRVQLATGTNTNQTDYHVIDAEPSAVIEDVEVTRRQPMLPDSINVQGFLYCIRSDEVVPVTPMLPALAPTLRKSAESA